MRNLLPGLVACAVGGLALTALAVPGADGAARIAAAPKACSGSQIAVWLGNGPGGATAGTTFFPIEFSNTSRRSCTLLGYPGVSAISRAGGQVGKPATRLQLRARTVLLVPGATAHAILGVVDWGAVCRSGVDATGLKVYAPGGTDAEPIDDFPIEVCANAATLRIEPVSSGVGIPGYTSS